MDNLLKDNICIAFKGNIITGRDAHHDLQCSQSSLVAELSTLFAKANMKRYIWLYGAITQRWFNQYLYLMSDKMFNLEMKSTIPRHEGMFPFSEIVQPISL